MHIYVFKYSNYKAILYIFFLSSQTEYKYSENKRYSLIYFCAIHDFMQYQTHHS